MMLVSIFGVWGRFIHFTSFSFRGLIPLSISGLYSHRAHKAPVIRPSQRRFAASILRYGIRGPHITGDARYG